MHLDPIFLPEGFFPQIHPLPFQPSHLPPQNNKFKNKTKQNKETKQTERKRHKNLVMEAVTRPGESHSFLFASKYKSFWFKVSDFGGITDNGLSLASS